MPVIINSYSFPTPTDFEEIEQTLLPFLDFASSPYMQLFPTRDVALSMVTWEQEDVYFGMMGLRGYNGDPKKIDQVGRNTFNVTPGVYGNFMAIDEREMLTAREQGTINGAYELGKNITRRQNQLLQIRKTREQWIISTLLHQGQFNVTNELGNVVHSDGYQQRVFVAQFPWSNLTQSTPLADMRAMQLMHRGYSVRFDRTSRLIVNRTQANYAVMNQNSADLFGRRTNGLATINTLGDLNTLLMNDDLPSLAIYDQEWYDDARVLNLWTPTGIGVLDGKRLSGVPAGEWFYCKNALREKGGAYTFVDQDKMKKIPPTLEVHDGFYGGPALKFPSSIIVAYI